MSLVLDATDHTKIALSDFGLGKFAAPKELMQVACGTLSYVGKIIAYLLF